MCHTTALECCLPTPDRPRGDATPLLTKMDDGCSGKGRGQESKRKGSSGRGWNHVTERESCHRCQQNRIKLSKKEHYRQMERENWQGSWNPMAERMPLLPGWRSESWRHSCCYSTAWARRGEEKSQGDGKWWGMKVERELSCCQRWLMGREVCEG